MTDAELDRALQLIAKTCDKQPLHFLWRPQLQDVADEMVLETAINGIYTTQPSALACAASAPQTVCTNWRNCYD